MRGQAIALENLGISTAVLGQPVRAITMLRQAFDLAQAIGYKSGEAGACGGLALAYLAAGKRALARKSALQAERLYRESGDKRAESMRRFLRELKERP